MSIDVSRVDFNSGIFLKELESRGAQLSYVGNSKVVRAKLGDHEEMIFDIFSSLYTYSTGWALSDKWTTKMLLNRSRISAPDGKIFLSEDEEDAIKYAIEIGFPVAIKPVAGGHGVDVYSGIESSEELTGKLNTLWKNTKGHILLEKHVFGSEYRVFYTKNDFMAVVNRIPASVIGDGENNIASLIKKENYRRMNPRVNCLCEIKTDDVMVDYLKKNKISLDYVPKKDERVALRLSSNVSMGGDCVDATERVHESIRALAKRVLSSVPNMPYVGFDLICEDVSKPLSSQEYGVLELNPSPGLSLHSLPSSGESRDVVGALVDLLFPETKG